MTDVVVPKSNENDIKEFVAEIENVTLFYASNMDEVLVKVLEQNPFTRKVAKEKVAKKKSNDTAKKKSNDTAKKKSDDAADKTKKKTVTATQPSRSSSVKTSQSSSKTSADTAADKKAMAGKGKII